MYESSLSILLESLGSLWHGAGAVSSVIPKLHEGFAPGTMLKYFEESQILCGIREEEQYSGAFMFLPQIGRMLVLEHCPSRDDGGYFELSRPFFMTSDFCFTRIGGIRIVDPEDESDYICLRSPWLNISDQLSLIGIYGGDDWGVWSEGSSDGNGRYRCRFIWSDSEKRDAGGAALDCGWLLCCGMDSFATRGLYEDARVRELNTGDGLCRAIWMKVPEVLECVFAVNFSADSAEQFTLPAGSWSDGQGLNGIKGSVEIESADCGLWIKHVE